MKIAVILGTRPEIIKMSPIITELERIQQIEYFILHTGQHYSYNMDAVFFQQLKLPQPKYNLEIGSGTHAEQTGKMLIGIEKILLKEKVDIALVQGDTNTTLAGSLAAAKIHVKVGHIEAGLRSRDKRMPEEINRILTDHISDYLFAPTEKAKQNLLNEGIEEEKIYVTGNTIVDAVYQHIQLTQKLKVPWEEKDYILLTLHRQENVDNPLVLKNILRGIELVYQKTHIPILFPIHPRTSKRLAQYNIQLPSGIKTLQPLDYLTFLKLLSKAKLVLTDSGGIQEEACILKIPCVTLRENTERPETIEVGANVLAGSNPQKILQKTLEMLNKPRNWKNPFGDGNAAKRIIKILINKQKNHT